MFRSRHFVPIEALLAEPWSFHTCSSYLFSHLFMKANVNMPPTIGKTKISTRKRPGCCEIQSATAVIYAITPLITCNSTAQNEYLLIIPHKLTRKNQPNIYIYHVRLCMLIILCCLSTEMLECCAFILPLWQSCEKKICKYGFFIVQ